MSRDDARTALFTAFDAKLQAARDLTALQNAVGAADVEFATACQALDTLSNAPNTPPAAIAAAKQRVADAETARIAAHDALRAAGSAPGDYTAARAAFVGAVDTRATTGVEPT